jgi:hypothetical protein
MLLLIQSAAERLQQARDGLNLDSLSEKPSCNLRGCTQSSLPRQNGGAIRKSPSIFFCIRFSDRYFNNIEAPKECPTKMISSLINEILLPICLSHPKSGRASLKCI